MKICRSNTYVTGNIVGYICSLYHGESMGIPNIPVVVVRNIKSKADKAINSLRNVSVNSELCLFRVKRTRFEILPTTPKQDTEN